MLFTFRCSPTSLWNIEDNIHFFNAMSKVGTIINKLLAYNYYIEHMYRSIQLPKNTQNYPKTPKNNEIKEYNL